MLIYTTIYYDNGNLQNCYCILTYSGEIGETGTPAAFEFLMQHATRKFPQSEALDLVDRYVDEFGLLHKYHYVKHHKNLVNFYSINLKRFLQTSRRSFSIPS